MSAGGGTPAVSAAYDRVAYPALPYRAAHPSRLAAIAHLHGLTPASPSTCRCLDLGCGEGVNAMSVAASLPGSRCLGIDASGEEIRRGEELRAAAELDRVELRLADLRDEDTAVDLQGADYVVVHGLFSWVEPQVRDAALRLAAAAISANGLLVISYNALPGWRLFEGARELALDRIAELPHHPGKRKEAALAAVRLALELHGGDDAYGRALALGVERYEKAEASLLYHDDLAPICEPLSLAQVAEVAGRHGLAYLDEALPNQWWAWRLAPDGVRRLRDASNDGPLQVQEDADRASGAVFKATVFAGEHGAEVDPARALDLHTSIRPDAPDAPESTSPAVARTLEAIREAAPRPVSVAEIADAADLSPATAGGAVLRLVAEEAVDLWLDPPEFATTAGPRPQATGLARAQAATGDRVANLRHEPVRFEEPLGRALLQLLDGSRDRARIAADLAARAPELGLEDVTPEGVEAVLDSHLEILAGQALLVA